MSEAAVIVADVFSDRCHAAESDLHAIRELITPLLGTEPCPVCADDAPWTPPICKACRAVNPPTRDTYTKCCCVETVCGGCNGTGARNIADPLSVVECVKRICGELIDFTKAWKEAVAKRDESQRQIEMLREALEHSTCYCNVATKSRPCRRCDALAATAPKEAAK